MNMKTIIRTLLIAGAMIFMTQQNSWSATDYNNADYDLQCPYGDAVIVDSEEVAFFGKIVGTGVECVNFNQKTRMWETWTNLGGNLLYQFFDPEKFRVYTEDGELVIANDLTVKIRSN